MSRRRPAEDGLLFDLPLERPPAAPPPAVDPEQPPLPLAEGEADALDAGHDIAASAQEHGPEAQPQAEAEDLSGAGPGPAAMPPAVTLRQRLAAGFTDIGVCAAVMVVLLVALLAQGVRPMSADWPAGAVFLLAFSFLYAVLPLAFWGRTPGMALAGLRAANRDGRPLTFRQAALRWLGSVLTVALCGLPLLLALGGRSLSDLVSGSLTGLVARQT